MVVQHMNGMCDSHNTIMCISISSSMNHLKNWRIQTIPIFVKYIIEKMMNSYPSRILD